LCRAPCAEWRCAPDFTDGWGGLAWLGKAVGRFVAQRSFGGGCGGGGGVGCGVLGCVGGGFVMACSGLAGGEVFVLACGGEGVGAAADFEELFVDLGGGEVGESVEVSRAWRGEHGPACE
jgi:hypothetical protein